MSDWTSLDFDQTPSSCMLSTQTSYFRFSTSPLQGLAPHFKLNNQVAHEKGSQAKSVIAITFCVPLVIKF